MLDWLDWVEQYPLYAQIIIGIFIYIVCMAVICLSIIGIRKITEILEELIRDIRSHK